MADEAEFSTAGVREAQQFDSYRHTVSSWLGFLPERPGGRTEPFQAWVSSRQNGPLRSLRFDIGGHLVFRAKQQINQVCFDSFAIYREYVESGASYVIDGQETITRPGDVMICDIDTQILGRTAERYRHEIILIPKSLLVPYLPRITGRLLLPLSSRAGVEALAVNFLDTLGHEWDNLPEAAMGDAADTLCRLIGVAGGATAGAQPNAVRQGRLAGIKRHVGQHLTNPKLSPATAAATLRIGLRTLHEAFEPEGVSFAAYVRQQRLERCRAALLAQPTRPVTDIAFALGFNSLPTFYRAFQAAFGLPPGDLRVAHLKSVAARDEGPSCAQRDAAAHCSE